MFTSRCTTPPACALAQPRQEVRRAIIGGAICRFRTFACNSITIRSYCRSHDRDAPSPSQSTAHRRAPARRELARAHRRDGIRCVRLRDRIRRNEATCVWPVEHAAGWADDGTGTAHHHGLGVEAQAELAGGGLAKADQAGLAHQYHHVGVHGRHEVGECGRAEGGADAGGHREVLDGGRYAGQLARHRHQSSMPAWPRRGPDRRSP